MERAGELLLLLLLQVLVMRMLLADHLMMEQTVLGALRRLIVLLNGAVGRVKRGQIGRSAELLIGRRRCGVIGPRLRFDYLHRRLDRLTLGLQLGIAFCLV